MGEENLIRRKQNEQYRVYNSCIRHNSNYRRCNFTYKLYNKLLLQTGKTDIR